MKSLNYPKIIYGTAWKKEKTKDIVVKAIKTGYRAIDTACQPKHYQENLVGDAIESLIKNNTITRNDIFIQTKFTSIDGQDPKNIPYDKKENLENQVKQSIEKSLSNLKTDYIDSLLMHSPMKNAQETIKVYNIFEEYFNKGIIKNLGISNIYSLELLEYVFNSVKIKPKFIQNRFYMQTNYDKDIRKFCDLNGIIYQSFWTLTANPFILENEDFLKICRKYKLTSEQLFFKFLIQLGICPLTGTTNENHMLQNLEIFEREEINKEDMDFINTFIA
jgi:diketogulonate reductase-like aldo/keto reductase